MTDRPSPHDRLAEAFKTADYDLPIEQRHALADAALAALKQELDALADYENRITWHTSCGSCARVLDSSIRETERAERAEGILASVLATFPDTGPVGPAVRSRLLPAELVHRWKQTAGGTQPEPDGEDEGLLARAADAIRDAACNGQCGQDEEECRQERIQPFVWRHGRLAVVEGTPEMFAAAVLSVALADRDAALDRVRALADRLEEFAENALKEDDRKLYAALASDLRTRIDGPALDTDQPKEK